MNKHYNELTESQKTIAREHAPSDYAQCEFFFMGDTLIMCSHTTQL